MTHRKLIATAIIIAISALLKAQNSKPAGTENKDITLVVEQIDAAVVSAKVPPVKVVEDTVEYNPAAFRLAEDAMLEDLLRKIPGLEIRGNSVYCNGRRVDQLLVNGKRFFGDNVKAGLQSLPADMVAKVCTYEIDPEDTSVDGPGDAENRYESKPVLDLKIKKNMMDAWRGSISGGYGSSNRYIGKGSANKIKKEEQTSIIADFNNLNGSINLNNASRTQLGGGSNGDRNKRDAGINLYRKKGIFEFDGNAKYSGFDQLQDSRRYSENVYSSGISSVYGSTDASNSNNVPSIDAKLVWKPSKQLSFTLKPSFKYTGNQNLNKVHNENIAMNGTDTTSIADNGSQRNQNIYNGHLVFTAFKNFNDSKKGRNLSATGEYHLTYSDEANTQSYHTTYNSQKADSDRRLHQYNANRNNSIKASMQYNEPLTKNSSLNFFLQGLVQITEGTKDLYDLKSADPGWKLGDDLPSNYRDYRMDDLCFQGKYNWYSLRAQIQYRYSTKKIKAFVGVVVQPQWTVLDYRDTVGQKAHNSHFLINAAPVLSVNWNPQKSEKLSFNYTSYPSQPSLYNLIPVYNGTNPLYLHLGNENLLPSYTHKLNLSYTLSNLKKQSSLSVNGQAQIIQDKITDIREYVQETGGSKNLPVNVGGNWLANASMVYNKGLPLGFSITQRASADYSNNMSYIYESHTSQLNAMRRFMIKERFETQYRNHWLEVIANLYGDYTLESSQLRPEIDQQPFSLGAGLLSNFDLPWGMRITVDYSYLFQNNYAFSQLNRDYHVLNASIRQAFLKKTLILSVEAYDCLKQLPNLTMSFSAYNRNIVSFNGCNSYIIGRLIYKFK